MVNWANRPFGSGEADAQQQASAGEVPECAYVKAYDYAYPDSLSDNRRLKAAHVRALGPIARAFARYIAAHEPAPVDPLQQIVEDADRAVWAAIGAPPQSSTFIGKMTAELRARGVTVAKGGE